MDNNKGVLAANNVISLFNDAEFAGNHPADDRASAVNALESMMSNPKFAEPANDEPQLSNLVKLAPNSHDCRQAKLLCMWAEILADCESA